MKHLILATAAVLSIASAVPALAARPQVKLQQLAASGKPTPQTNTASEAYALNGVQVQDGGQRNPQLAAGNHPQANSDAHGTQLATAGGAYPQASIQLAASGFQYVQRSHGEI